MIVPSQPALKTHTNFGCAASLATFDKLVDRFPVPPVAPPIDDTSHSCYEACGTFNYVTNATCDGTKVYNNPVLDLHQAIMEISSFSVKKHPSIKLKIGN
jgi:hypothetical protein